MVQRARTAQRLAGAVAGAALLLAVSACTASASPSETSSSEPSESSGPTSTPIASASESSTPDQTTAGAWTATGNMVEVRSGYTATLLLDGTVLVAGGYSSPIGSAPTPLASVELYDPSSGIWTATGIMIEARGLHTATLLPDGTVLVAGGGSNSGVSTELYDPASGSWTATGNMIEPFGTIATLLLDGRVLVVGGRAQIYDPSSGSWTATGSMIEARAGHTTTLLPDGKVLVAGGFIGFDGGGVNLLASSELYDPGSGSWTATGSMIEARAGHTATLLPDGTVLVAGGDTHIGGARGPVASAERYDPGNGTWTATASMATAREGQTATLLPDGTVLVAAGYSTRDMHTLASAELYDPSSGSWTATGTNMIEARMFHTATLLPDGKMLVVGGFNTGEWLASAELYDPGSGN